MVKQSCSQTLYHWTLKIRHTILTQPGQLLLQPGYVLLLHSLPQALRLLHHPRREPGPPQQGGLRRVNSTSKSCENFQFGRWCEDTIVVILVFIMFLQRIMTTVSSHHRPNQVLKVFTGLGIWIDPSWLICNSVVRYKRYCFQVFQDIFVHISDQS